MKKYIVMLCIVAIGLAGADSTRAETTNSISQWDITWHFDKNYEYGQFANGDYWVKTDPGTNYVRITAITPDVSTFTVNGTSYLTNGWEVNPTPYGQAFDQRLTSYSANLRPSLPYNATAGSSVIKAISRLVECVGNACRPGLKTAAVLTVVGQTPPDNGSTVFRPPYVGTEKPMRSVSEIRWDRIPSYGHVSDMPSLDWVVNSVGKVQMDHIRNQNQQTRPSDNMAFYGANLNQTQGDAVLRVLMNDSEQAKTPAVIAVLQAGIDYYHFIINGQTWPRGSGEQPGRIILPLFASYIFDDTDMQSVFPTQPTDNYPYETHILKRNQNGVVLWGEYTTINESVYWSKIEGGHSAPGSASLADPYGYIDGGYSPGAVYQECCTSQGFKQTALIMHLVPGLKSIWPFQELLDYADRWVEFGVWTQPDPCAPVTSDGTRGVDYGPDPNNPGACIEGSGRFPSRHGEKADAGLRYSNFAASMWINYRYSSNIAAPTWLRVLEGN